MTRLKLSDITDEKPLRVTIELPAKLHRDLQAYAVVLGGGDAKSIPTIEKLIPPMLDRFITTDRGFAKYRKKDQAG